ncbi:hypothetical protein H009_02413 [Agrobacterium tumefaciens str. Cherry 2E-2-2]|nr:hypothetical protein H009_02413 [Agrobacterium tumefaciens str. Cherry 2E-2-2]
MDRMSGKAASFIGRFDMLEKHLSFSHMAGLSSYYLLKVGGNSVSLLKEIGKGFDGPFASI